jgi:hypothetical protein
MSPKLTKRHVSALSYLAAAGGWRSALSIPNGNGHTSGGGATYATLSELKRYGLIDYGKAEMHSYYGYRITDAGRAALSEPQP